MKIAVAGTGYVGLVTGVALANIGHNVTCVDLDDKKIEIMKNGISPIYEKDLEEKVLVQGVIDLYYISSNGELVLVDFKTDYVPDKNEQILIERYSSQLQLYKRALESATGKRVNKTYIYSTYLEKEIKI